MKLYDLHTHSNRSDGCLTPAKVVREAVAAGMSVLALTDHDTASGCAEAAAESAKMGLGFVPGVEISALEPEGIDTLHILGLDIDPDDAARKEKKKKCTRSRLERTYKLCCYFEGFGLRLDPERINAAAGNVGKPHIALEMVRCGYVSTVKEAFDKYLDDPAIDRIKKFKLPYEEVFSLIHGAGGLAVMAHPYQTGLSAGDLRKFAGLFREAGLDGIECYYSRHTPEQTEFCISLAKELGLLISCGSDFHGKDVKPDIRIGTGRNGSLTALRLSCPIPGELDILKRLK